MSYKAVNEMNHFDFHESQLDGIVKTASDYVLTLDAVIARHNVSCNDMLTDRYCSTMTLTLSDASIEDILLEGYKYYDANDRLVETKPDKEIPVVEYDKILKECAKGIVFEVAEKEKQGDYYRYLFLIDTDEETTYCVTIRCTKTTATWEHLMNKVMM